MTAFQMVAMLINLNGFLCATVIEINPLHARDQYEVTCIEYMGGTGKVRYILNMENGLAFRAG
jgi:hypothetical protein